MASASSYGSFYSLARRLGCVELAVFLFALGAGAAEISFISELKYEEAKGLMVQKKWAEAAIVLSSVIRDEPRFSLAAIDLAKALVQSDRREEALSILAQAASLEKGAKRAELVRRAKVISRMFLSNPTFQIYQEGMTLVSSRKYKLARERFERALLREPDNVEILTRIGQCLVLEDDYDSAAEKLRMAKRLNPHEPEVRLWLGRALHKRGELQQAISEFQWARERLKGSELAVAWLADAHFASGQKQVGLQLLEHDTKVRPFHVSALLALARLRLAYSPRDMQSLWAARKDLQLALSRFEYYSNEYVVQEGELGLDLRETASMKSEIKALLQQVQSRLDAKPAHSNESTL